MTVKGFTSPVTGSEVNANVVRGNDNVLAAAINVVEAVVATCVAGPASSTDNAVARYDGTTGKLIQNSSVTISDAGFLTSGNSTGNVNLEGTNAKVAIFNTTNTGGFDVGLLGGAGDANAFVYQRHNAALAFGTNNTTRLTISATGDITATGSLTVDTDTLFVDAVGDEVGIGTTTPSSKLDVYVTGTSSNVLPATIGGLAGVRITGSVSNVSTVGLMFESGSGGGAVIGFARGGSYDTEIIFGTNAGSNAVYGGVTERMRIDASGNVGIGTASPVSFGAGSAMLTVSGTTTYGGVIGATNNVQVQLWADEAQSDVKVGSRTNHPLIVTTNNVERARIDTSGNVTIADLAGVGTRMVTASATGVLATSPQGATITDPTGGTVQDSEARTAINAIIDRLQAHGLIA